MKHKTNSAMQASIISLFIVLSTSQLLSEETGSKAEPDKTKEQPVMVVTASHIEMQKKESGSNITVITKEEIEKSGYQDLTSLLRGYEGITINQNNAFGGVTSLVFRGSKSGNAVILINGVKMNPFVSIGTSYDMSHLLLADIERIEITRGANSTTYGSNATGGVINIITGTKKKDGLTMKAEGGSYSITTSAAYQKSTKNIAFNLGAQILNAYGISKAEGDNETDPYLNITLNGNLNAKITKNMKLNYSITYIDSFQEIDDGASTGDNDRANISRNLATKITYNHSPLQWLKYDITASYMMYDYKDDDPSEAVNTLTTHMPHGRVNILFNLLDINTILVGGEWTLETGENGGTWNDIQHDRFNHSYYIQDHLRLLERIFITGGVRIELNEIGYFFSYNASGSFIIPVTETNIKVNWGMGNRTPTFYELYSGFGDQNLKEESSMTVDAGLIQPFWNNRLKVGGFFFYGEHWDEIDFNGGTFKYYNIGDTTTYMGVESYIEFKPLNWLSFRIAYTWTDAKQSDGSQALKRPEHQASFSMKGTFIEKLSLFSKMLYMSERLDTTGTLPWYIRWDLSISYQVDNLLNVHLRGENLTNAQYQEAKGYNMPGISIYGGLKVQI